MTGSMQQGITALHCSVCSDSLIPAAELCSVMLMHINIILITHNTNIILISNGFKSDIRVNWKDVASPVSLWRLHASLRAARVQFHICAVTLPGQQGAHYGLTGSDLRPPTGGTLETMGCSATQQTRRWTYVVVVLSVLWRYGCHVPSY